MRLLVLYAMLLSLSSCTVGPDYQRPSALVPKKYKLFIKSRKTVQTNTKFGQAQIFDYQKDISAQWWELFKSDGLNDLIREAFKHNPDIGAARASLKAAHELAIAQRGQFLPNFSIAASPNIQQTAGVLQSNLASNNYVYTLYTGQLLLNFNLNAFGHLTRQQEALMGDFEASHFELEAAYLSLSSNLTSAVIQAASYRAQRAYLKKLVKAQSEIVYIFRKRYELGDLPLSDLVVQEALLAQNEANLPLLKEQILLQRNYMNSLVGRYPNDKRTPKFYFKSFKLPVDLPLTMPSTLLEHRPDIRAAEARMKAANAMVGVAVANRVPMVTIGSSNLGTAALQLGNFFASNTTFWGLAGFITQPLFMGGRLLHEQRAAEALYHESEAIYKQSIIHGFKEVADALRSIEQDSLALKIAYKAERSAFKALQIARLQLTLGDSSAITILINLTLWEHARMDLIKAQAERLQDTVALFQALGGGWWNKAEYRCMRDKNSKHCKQLKDLRMHLDTRRLLLPV